MGRHRTGTLVRSSAPTSDLTGTPGRPDQRHVRAPWSLPSFAFLVSVCFVLVPIVDPSAAFALSQAVNAPGINGPGIDDAPQTISAGAAENVDIDRNEFDVSIFHSTAPAVAVPDPDTAKGIAYAIITKKGWNDAEYACLVSLWERESHWNVSAYNASSGAYGIPQALPGEKMASVGSNWKTSARTQIVWGLGYIEGRYATPCGAWKHSESSGWY